MVEDNPRDVGHEMDNLNVVYADESLPHLYENSRISVDQLPSQEGILEFVLGCNLFLYCASCGCCYLHSTTPIFMQWFFQLASCVSLNFRYH